MTKAEITCQRLESEGWQFDRQVTYKGYEAAGDVTPMRCRGYYDYVRVHTGRSVCMHKYQVTLVYRRLRKDLREVKGNE